ncbi:hypothetical protein BHE74_00020292 [Ensete ventricosum]|uniref:Uncharacterized protein n=1 Tax=Ensete ventricosum TaxID=4639 RepID=A0A445MF83_ENSVE|nr:hypothetical protein BHE74_00020292 [Ensete ventricosum]RZR72856.1 hypothetical protein BHM03_00017979 [Ensete ventricosum]
MSPWSLTTGYLARSGSNGAGELLSHSAQATVEGPLTAPHLTNAPLEWAAQEEGESKKTEEEASGMAEAFVAGPILARSYDGRVGPYATLLVR